ncbi:MAG TPA: hypothetical protein VI456_09430 [Polyangia bacterium]
MRSRRQLPGRIAVEQARTLLQEAVARDPTGRLGLGLKRFGSWQSLAAVVGTDWLPFPRRGSAATARIVRQRLRALGAEPAPSEPAEGEPHQVRGACESLPGTPAGDLWRASMVEDDAGPWAVEEGADFFVRAPDGRATLVLADGGRLVNASRLGAGDEVAVFGVGAAVPDRAGLTGAHGRGGAIPALRSDPSRPLLVSVIRRYDQGNDGPQD